MFDATYYNNAIGIIELKHDNKVVNFLISIINKPVMLPVKHPNRITNFSADMHFYKLNDRNNESYVLSVIFIGDEKTVKIRYGLDGTLINHVVDHI